MQIRVNVNAAIVRDGKILLIEFNDATGRHLNFPGGGIDPGESMTDVLTRECREEANAEVQVGRLLLVWEYLPEKLGYKFGTRPKIGLVYECRLAEGSDPKLPMKPHLHQSGVKWVPLEDLEAGVSGAKKCPILPKIGLALLVALRDPHTSAQVLQDI